MIESANISDIKKLLLSKDGKNTFAKNGVISEHKDLMIRTCFSKIAVKTADNEYVLKNFEDVDKDDEILILNLDQSTSIEGKYRLIFIKKMDFFKKEREFSSTGVEEYIELMINTVKDRFGTENLDVYMTLEEPFLAIIPDLNSISIIQAKELFREYMESYTIPMRYILNKALNDKSGKLSISAAFGKEFEYSVLGEYKIPIWVTSNEDVFSKYKNEILSKLKDADLGTLIPENPSEVDNYIDKYDRRIYEIQYRIKFVKSNKILGDFAKWSCIGPSLFRLANLNCITDLVNLIDNEVKSIDFEETLE